MNTVYALIGTHGLWALGIGCVVIFLYLAGRTLFDERCPPFVVFVIAAASLYIVTRGAVLPLMQLDREGITTAQLQNNPVVNERLAAAIERHLPGFRDRLARQVRDTLARKGAAAARGRMHLLTIKATETVLLRTMSYAADGPLLRLVRTEIDIVKSYTSSLHGPCYYLGVSATDAGARRVNDAVPDREKMRYYARAAEAIESSERDRATPMTEAQAMPVAVKVIERVRRTVGPAALEAMSLHRPSQDSTSRVLCDAHIAILEEVLRLPEAQAGGLLRWLISKSQS